MKPFSFFFTLSMGILLFFALLKFAIVAFFMAAIFSIGFFIVQKIGYCLGKLQWFPIEHDKTGYSPFSNREHRYRFAKQHQRKRPIYIIKL